MAELKVAELKDIAKSLKLKGYEELTKQKLLILITEKLGEKADSIKSTDSLKHSSLNIYTRGEQLGDAGKDGRAYRVTDKHGTEYAMKVFKKNKTTKRLVTEVELQKLCADAGISPKIIDYDTEEKFIVMDKMDAHLYDILKAQRGILTKIQQKQVLQLFSTLDKVGVFHGDANILNYMYKKTKLYIIDFGYSKLITDDLKKKLNVQSPNMELMLLGFVVKLKEIGCPPAGYDILVSKLPTEKRKQFGI